MSKNSAERVLVLIVVALLLTTVAGCTRLRPEDRFRGIKVPREKLRQIETLDLKDMKSEEDTPAEPNAAPPELTLTLEEARVLALQHNLDLKVDLLAPTIAAEAINAEEAKFEWAFFSNASFVKTDRPQATAVSLVGSQVDFASVDLGVQMPLRTGGTVTFDLADNRTKTDFSGRLLNPSYENDFTLSISQPLLRNAGKRVNMHSIRVARYDAQITDATTKLNVITVIAAADRVYWNLYAARRVLEVREQQYELAEAQLARARRFVEAGQNPQVDLIRAEAGLAGQLATIIAAENDLRNRQRDLKRTLNKPGLSMETPTVLIPVTQPDPLHYQLDSKKLVDFGIENRMEMLELELQIAQNLSTIDFLRNQTLPLLSLNYDYVVHGLGETRSSSFDILNNRDFEDHRIRVGLTIPLGNQAARSNLRQALYRRRQQLATRKKRRALVEQEVLNALDQLEASWQQILANRQSAILDGRLYQAEQRQFELGMRTSTDVLEAQTNFADSQSAEIRALANYQIATVNLAEATGTLLGAAKIDWQPIVPDIGIKP